VVSLRGVLATCALVLGLRGGADAGRWPQPVLGTAPQAALGELAQQDVEVLFTFDDGPSASTTPELLDILAQHQIRAVFFLVGKQVLRMSQDAPELLDRIVREGHILANHTMWHSDLCKDPTEEAIIDLDVGRQVIERTAAMRLAWFRAPFGVRCEQLDELLAERGLTHFHWDLDPQEWRHGSVARTVKYVTDRLARATGRNVLLMHDIKPVTVVALPKILQWIADENARRAETGKPRIRVLQAPDVAVERIPPDVRDVLDEALDGARALPRLIASVLP
jgi:chitooligosaccharide deacetylase